MKYILTLLLLLLLFTGCGGEEPTLAPTITSPPTWTPVLETATPPPTWTPVPSPTVFSTPTPTPAEAAATAPADQPVCDEELLNAYRDIIQRLSGIHAELESQGYEQEIIPPYIPQVEALWAEADALAAPCDSAFWLRQMMLSEMSIEIQNLKTAASSRSRNAPVDITLIDRMNKAAQTLQEEVEALQAGPVEATPTLPSVAWDCSGDVYDCTYFYSKEEAQQCYDYCFPKAGDIHKLDEDGNGIACDSPQD